MTSRQNTLEIIEAVNGGNQNAREELLFRVYEELRYIAANYMQHERVSHTLQPTALVHEAYLRLAEQKEIKWQNREHFIALAATMMRRVLINYAISNKREKRGGGDTKLPLEMAENIAAESDLELVLLSVALEKMAKDYPQESQVVVLRFFGGLTIDETAQILEISDSTVERDWKFAKAWLLREISND